MRVSKKKNYQSQHPQMIPRRGKSLAPHLSKLIAILAIVRPEDTPLFLLFPRSDGLKPWSGLLLLFLLLLPVQFPEELEEVAGVEG